MPVCLARRAVSANQHAASSTSQCDRNCSLDTVAPILCTRDICVPDSSLPFAPAPPATPHPCRGIRREGSKQMCGNGCSGERGGGSRLPQTRAVLSVGATKAARWLTAALYVHIPSHPHHTTPPQLISRTSNGLTPFTHKPY